MPFLSIFFAFLRLGCVSFGGPIAHLGYYHRVFVLERRWLSEAQFAQMVAIAQFLPGPASCQTNFLIGWQRAGSVLGGLAAFTGFVLPSALIMLSLALSSQYWIDAEHLGGLFQGLKIAAVVIIVQALWGMSARLCPDLWRRLLTLAVLLVQLFWPGLTGQLVCLLLAALTGLCCAHRLPAQTATEVLRLPQPQGLGAASLLLFVLLLIVLPLAQHNPLLQVADSFYRSGALVFGGGHVVLPLLQNELVASGRLDLEQFLLGYASAQALPGPLFTLAGFLGSLEAGLAGGLVALAAIFLPGFLLLIAVLPVWQRLQSLRPARGILAGINAAVVGFLAAALAGPVSQSALLGGLHLLLAALGAGLLWRWGLKALLPGLAAAGALLF